MVGYPRNEEFDRIEGAHFGPAEITPEQDIYGIPSAEIRSLLEGTTDPQCHSANCNRRVAPFPPSIKTCCYICGYPAFQKGGQTGDTFGVQCEHLIPVAALSSLCTLSDGGGSEPFTISYEKFRDLSGLSEDVHSEYEDWREILHKIGDGGGPHIEGGGIHGTVYLWAHPSCNEIKGNFPFIPLKFSPGRFSFLKDNGTTVAAAAGGGSEQKMKGGMISERNIRECISEKNLSWLLASLVGLNIPYPDIKDGGSKSKKFRQSICGLGDSGNLITKKNFQAKLREGKTEWCTETFKFPFAVPKSKKEDCDIHRLQLWKNGKCVDENCTPEKWVEERVKYIMNEILIPLVRNICKDPVSGTIISSDKLQRFHNISVSATALRIKDKVVKFPKSFVYKSKGQISKLPELIQSFELWEKMIDAARKNCKIKARGKKDADFIKKIKKSLKDPLVLAATMGSAWKKAIGDKFKKKPKAPPKKEPKKKEPKKQKPKRVSPKKKQSDKKSTPKKTSKKPKAKRSNLKRGKAALRKPKKSLLGRRNKKKSGGGELPPTLNVQHYNIEPFCDELFEYLMVDEEVFDLVNEILSRDRRAYFLFGTGYITSTERNIGIILSEYFNTHFDDDMLLRPENGQEKLRTLLDIQQYNTEVLKEYITDKTIGRLTRSKNLLGDEELQDFWSEILYNDLSLPDIDGEKHEETEIPAVAQVMMQDAVEPMDLPSGEKDETLSMEKKADSLRRTESFDSLPELDESDLRQLDDTMREGVVDDTMSEAQRDAGNSEGVLMEEGSPDVSRTGSDSVTMSETQGDAGKIEGVLMEGSSGVSRTGSDKGVVPVDMEVSGIHDYKKEDHTPSHHHERQKTPNELRRAATVALETQKMNPEMEKYGHTLAVEFTGKQLTTGRFKKPTKKKPKRGKKSTKKKPKRGKKSTKKKPKKGKKSTKKKPKRGKKSKH